jgi:hypothetical protein
MKDMKFIKVAVVGTFLLACAPQAFAAGIDGSVT